MEYIFPKMSIVIYSGIGTIVLGVLLLLGIAYGRKGPVNYIFGSIICVIIGIFLLQIAKGGALKIQNQTVTLKIPMYSQKIFTADQIAEARISNLDAGSPYLPVRKKSGSAFKNFKSGWFTLKNGEKAFLLLEGKKGLYIKTTSGDNYVIGIQNFDRLLEVFQNEIKKVTS
jgi:hypothetical protein